MAAEPVAEVRRFNRTITQRIGALNDSFLARGRPLGESRLLWQIGTGSTSLRTLRDSLELDSGYLSRLLQSLQSAGLVEIGTDADDRRVRTARLTAAGRAERAELDRLSDRQAAAMLEPLGREQQLRLVAAMAEVQRLLLGSAVRLTERDPVDRPAREAITAYFAELHSRFEGGFDPGRSNPADDDDLRPRNGLLLVADLHGRAVGCAALKFGRDAAAEVKRMWVSPDVRGLGLGRRLLAELESRARGRGIRVLRLETNSTLAEAIGLYRASGYREVPAFNSEPYAHHWFEKTLEPADPQET